MIIFKGSEFLTTKLLNSRYNDSRVNHIGTGKMEERYSLLQNFHLELWFPTNQLVLTCSTLYRINYSFGGLVLLQSKIIMLWSLVNSNPWTQQGANRQTLFLGVHISEVLKFHDIPFVSTNLGTIRSHLGKERIILNDFT